MQAADLAHPRGEYGIDAPYVPLALGAGGIVLLAVAAVNAWSGFFGPWANATGLGGVWLLASTASYLYTTRVGKFRVWAEVLRELHLAGRERILDLGCGRGAVLFMAAKLVPEGKAVGVDLWKVADQSGNSQDVTLRNAEIEGVQNRVELRTADIRELPFADAEFDVALSSLAIHNITDPAGRDKALEEAVRVLKPGGRLVIADIQATGQYAERLRRLGMSDITHRPLDWRFWYGGPWVPTRLVTARKPRATN